MKAFGPATVGFVTPFLFVWNPFMLGYSTRVDTSLTGHISSGFRLKEKSK
ncbi:MAG: hypothetical protein JRJ02_10580 [Deltaproteobacteria bacterium]|nr:hypothetical protein [Deltaproteobacteria bacterium]MBW1862803.1 hypothetical protein [Deltaproteobacteria bacterium]